MGNKVVGSVALVLDGKPSSTSNLRAAALQLPSPGETSLGRALNFSASQCCDESTVNYYQAWQFFECLHNNFCALERDTFVENSLVVVKGEGVGEGWSGSLGLADAN